jgi:GldM C-terminal domain
MNKYLLMALHGFLAYYTTAQPFAVQVEKTNVLFVGVSNEMHIVVNDVAPERLVLLPSMGKIDTIDLKSGYYIWKICKKDTSVARLILADSVCTNPIDTLLFRVNSMPEPDFRFVRPRAHIMGHIVAVYANPDLHYMEDSRVKIVGFDMCYYPQKPDLDPLTLHNPGMRFSSDVSGLINRATPGDRYCFYNFQWKTGCDETIRKSAEVLQFLIK